AVAAAEGPEAAGGHPVARRAGVIRLARQDRHLDDALLAGPQDAGVDRRRCELRIVGIDVAAPDAAASSAGHFAVEDLAALTAEVGDRRRRRARGPAPPGGCVARAPAQWRRDRARLAPPPAGGARPLPARPGAVARIGGRTPLLLQERLNV